MSPLLRLLWAFMALMAPLMAQTESDSLRSSIEEGLATTSPDSEAQAHANYQSALAAINRAREFDQQAVAFRQLGFEAPGRLEAQRAEWAALASPQPAVDAESLSVEDLERGFTEMQSRALASAAAMQDLEAEQQLRTMRRGYIPEELGVLGVLLSQAQQSDQREGSTVLAASERALWLAKTEEFRSHSGALEAERASYEARQALLQVRLDVARRRAAVDAEEVNAWRSAWESRRQALARNTAQAVDQVIAESLKNFPELAQLAQECQDLAERRTGESGLPMRAAKAHDDLAEIREMLSSISFRSRGTKRRIAAVGLNEAMGQILRRDLEWLPPDARLKQDAERSRRELSSVQLELVEAEEIRERTAGGTLSVDDWLASEGLESASEKTRQQAQQLLAMRRDLRESIHEDLISLSAVLLDYRAEVTTLTQEVQSYREYLSSKIFWVRSATLSLAESMRQLPQTGKQMLGAWSWQTVGQGAKIAYQQSPFGLILLLLLGLGLLIVRGRLKTRIEDCHHSIRSYRTDRIGRTVEVLLSTLGLVAPLPIFLWLLGVALENSDSSALQAIGGRWCTAAWLWFMLGAWRAMMAPNGLAQLHFRWPNAQLKVWSRELAWLQPTVVLLATCTFSPMDSSPDGWSDTIGRWCFLLLMASYGLFGWRLLRASAQASKEARAAEGMAAPGSWLQRRAAPLWLSLALGVPLALFLATILGFFFTALEIDARLRQTVLFGMVLAISYAFLLRWLASTKRKLAVAQALAQKAKRQEHEEGEGDPGEGLPPSLDDEQIDIPSVDAQTRKLFRSGISLATVIGVFLIWADVFPALDNLNQIQVYPKFAMVEASPELVDTASLAAEVETASEGVAPSTGFPMPTSLSRSEVAGPVLTLAEVLIAIILLVVLVVFSRNLPALVELTLLQRLPLDSGIRYAISTLLRYAIVLVGLGAISNTLGVGWEHVQWLVAALTFGLAFGLQEIFANFISGLIILFERPIRVGDVISVGQVEGRVTQLRMRATTILDWNRREMLVPNKEFITQQVVNWSLSDSITRLIIPVGIAYGSDVALARKRLMECAQAEPLVLKDPEPNAIFRGFGESSLDFELRIFIPNRDSWPTAMDSMHSRIDAAFRESHIEIAFPQRDLHVRTMPKES